MRWQLASTLAALAMSGCFKESTVPCPDGVLCPADQACTGNTSGLRCGAEIEVMQCRDNDGALCTRAVDLDENGMGDDGFCEAALCTPCAPDLYQCRYDVWTPMGSSASNLESVWIASERDAYAVGAAGVVLRYDGERWSALPMVASGPALVGVWGQAQDVFAISNVGAIYRNGADMQANAPNNLTAIWGSAATNLVVAGAEGLLGEFDGASWSWTATGGLSSFNDVSGVSDGVLAVGLGRIRHRTGQGTWATIPPPNNTDVLEGVWGVSSTDFYVVGHPELPPNDVHGVIHHYKDGTWTTPTIPSQPRVPRLYAIWGSSSSDIHAVGEDGTFVHYDAVSWSYSNGNPSSTAPTLNDIAGVDRDAIVVGIDGSIVRLSPR